MTQRRRFWQLPSLGGKVLGTYNKQSIIISQSNDQLAIVHLPQYYRDLTIRPLTLADIDLQWSEFDPYVADAKQLWLDHGSQLWPVGIPSDIQLTDYILQFYAQGLIILYDDTTIIACEIHNRQLVELQRFSYDDDTMIFQMIHAGRDSQGQITCVYTISVSQNPDEDTVVFNNLGGAIFQRDNRFLNDIYSIYSPNGQYVAYRGSMFRMLLDTHTNQGITLPNYFHDFTEQNLVIGEDLNLANSAMAVTVGQRTITLSKTLVGDLLSSDLRNLNLTNHYPGVIFKAYNYISDHNLQRLTGQFQSDDILLIDTATQEVLLLKGFNNYLYNVSQPYHPKDYKSMTMLAGQFLIVQNFEQIDIFVLDRYRFEAALNYIDPTAVKIAEALLSLQRSGQYLPQEMIEQIISNILKQD